MTKRLQGHVQGGSPGGFAYDVPRNPLGMRLAAGLSGPFANADAGLYDYAADRRIGPDVTAHRLRQIKRSPHPAGIVRAV